MKIQFLFFLFWWFRYCQSNLQAIRASKISNFMREAYPEMYSNQYQGDIFLFNDIEESKNAIRDESYRWPNATIPFIIGSNFSEEDQGKIMQAINRIQNETCIKFVPWNHERHYIEINNKKNAGCFAVIGYHKNSNKPHPVNLETPGCLRYQGTVEHELLHIIGLFHEQSRYDRDEHVHIYWGNITEEYKSNFEKVSEWASTAYQVPYDINSVMHYPRYSFSKNGNETIVYKKNPSMQLGQRLGATQGDLEKVRRMYSCIGNHTGLKPYGTPEWFIDQVNKFFNEQKENTSTISRVH